jgi:TetR/AcrR family transcriptional regulator, tetracycline repressor protein
MYDVYIRRTSTDNHGNGLVMRTKQRQQHRSAEARAQRHGLSRARVLEEARRLLEAHGPEALSMRALAQRLGVSPMALYNHVSSKEDLIQGIANTVVQDLCIAEVRGTWRQRVRGCFRALRQVCLANPRTIPLVEAADVLHPAVFRPMEMTLAALVEAGIEPHEALEAYFLLTNFTMGQVSYQIRGPFRGLDPAEAVRRGTIGESEFPLVAKVVAGGAWDFDAAFERGLDVIIEGLAARGKQRRRPRTR